jgi:hypothetical protein
MSGWEKNKQKKWLFRNPKMLEMILSRYPVCELLVTAQRLVYSWKQVLSS